MAAFMLLLDLAFWVVGHDRAPELVVEVRQAWEAVQAATFQAVVIWKTDRLARRDSLVMKPRVRGGSERGEGS